jgi:hypothetical protein
MNHKYGFHVNRTGEDVLDAIRRIRPQVVKTLEHDIGFWTRVRSIHPDVYLIGRLYVPNHEQDQFAEAPAAKGRAFAERILRLETNRTTFQGRPLFDAWESYNEVLPGHADSDLKRKYDDFQVAFAGPIKAAGFEPIAMNFATGNMLGNDFLDFFPGTLESYRVLGFHEYDWPDMWRLHEENIREKNEGGMWLTLRYRRIMNDVRRVYGDRHTVIITECGMTQGVQGGADVGPWHESHPIAEERYWDSLMWYNDQLRQDDYVRAALLFVVGAVSPWQSFEHLGSIMNRLEAYQRTTPDREETEERPQPEQPEPEQPEQPKPHEPPVTLNELLLAAAARAQVIHLNPDAALQKQIFADGFVPNSKEFQVEKDGVAYLAQRAEHLGSGEIRIYHVRVGDWANVAYIRGDGDTGQQIA